MRFTKITLSMCPTVCVYLHACQTFTTITLYAIVSVSATRNHTFGKIHGILMSIVRHPFELRLVLAMCFDMCVPPTPFGGVCRLRCKTCGK